MVTSAARKTTSPEKSKHRLLTNSFIAIPIDFKKSKKPVSLIRRDTSKSKKSGNANWEPKISKPTGRIPAYQIDDDPDPELQSVVVNGIGKSKVSPVNSTKSFDDCNDPVQCKICKKAIFMSSANSHIQQCIRKRSEKQQKKKEAKEAKDAALRKERNGGISPDPDGSARKGVTGSKRADGLWGAKKTGKRKADEDVKGAAKKKKKDDGKPTKNSKTKGPVDVEKQCGVTLPNGQMCARSLTCKSHSMGAKRSVPGRSMPYDVLLAQYQKKNHARQHRAAMDANGPLQDDFETQANIDSDEERDQVMAAISRYCGSDPVTGARTMGSPLALPHQIPVSRRYNHIRLKESMKSALDGATPGSRLFQSPSLFSSAPIFSAS